MFFIEDKVKRRKKSKKKEQEKEICKRRIIGAIEEITRGSRAQVQTGERKTQEKTSE